MTEQEAHTVRMFFPAAVRTASASSNQDPRAGRTVRLGLWFCFLVPLTVAAEAQRADLPELPAELPQALEENPNALMDQARSLAKEGNLTEASRAANQASRMAWKDVRSGKGTMDTYNKTLEVLTEIGHQAKKADELSVAYRCFSFLRNMNPPRKWEPLLNLADVARLSNRPWEAFELYSDYLKLKPSDRPQDHRGHLGMGEACLTLGKHQLARYHLERALTLAPNNAECRMALARAIHGMRRYADAVPHAEEAVRQDAARPPEERNPEYRYHLAVILRDAGRLDRGIDIARELTDTAQAELKANPADLEAIGRMERVLDLREDLLTRYMETPQGSQNMEVLVDMAQVLEAQGALKQIRASLSAIEVLNRALELDANNVPVLLQIGRLSRAVGDEESAVQAYQAVLKVSSDNEEAKKVLRELGAPLTAPEATTKAATAAK